MLYEVITHAAVVGVDVALADELLAGEDAVGAAQQRLQHARFGGGHAHLAAVRRDQQSYNFV